MGWIKRIGITLCAAGAALWLGNTSAFHSGGETRLLSHRGVHQIARAEAMTADGCRAGALAELRHGLIENTLPSMRAAFDAGADVVELDVHLTQDGVFAVFHDWTLDCQTDGTGVVREQEWARLKDLDLGYGYTVDGLTYPLRGAGVGLMPTLTEIATAELPGPVLVNFKSRDGAEGTALAEWMVKDDRAAIIWGVYGGGPPTRAAQNARPGLRGFDRAGLKDCIIRYALTGWTGFVPHACRTGLIAVPLDVAPYLWGWPHRFTARMGAVGTEVALWGPLDGSGFSSGIDDAETLAKVPDGFDGLIWTDRIEVIGPLLAGD